MELDELWGRVADQPAAVAAVRGAVERDEVSHAWLVVGPPGTGQTELAEALVAHVNHPSAGAADIAGRGRVLRGVHPNLVVHEPAGPEYLVKVVRDDWVPTASRSLSEGTTRVVRIIGADRMNETAQNAFLKVLEEPPGATVWMLEAEDTDALLDTIISRCRRVDLRPWRPASLARVATDAGVAPERVTAVVRAAGGSPDRVRDLVAREQAVLTARASADDDLAAAREKLAKAQASTARSKQRSVRAAQRAIAAAERQRDLPTRPGREVVRRLLDRGPQAILATSTVITDVADLAAGAQEASNTQEMVALRETYADDGGLPKALRQQVDARHRRRVREARRRSQDAALEDLGSWLRDVALVQAHGPDRTLREGVDGPLADALVHTDDLPALVDDARRVQPGAAVTVASAIATAREAFDRNGQPQLQVERLLLDTYAAVR